MPAFFGNMDNRVALGLVITVALVVVWVWQDLPVLAMPGLMIPSWVPLLTGRDPHVAPRDRQTMFLGAIGGALVVLIGVLVAVLAGD